VETRWRDLVIVDYEIGLPGRAALEWELYSQGMLRVPTVLLDEPHPFGRQRRPGIIDIPEGEYDVVLARIAQLLLDLDGVRCLASRADRLFTMVEEQLAIGDRQAGTGFPVGLIEQLCQLMALHVINWMWPFEEFKRIASAVLGDEGAGHRAVLSLLVPTAPAHMLSFHQHVLAAVEQVATDPASIHAVAVRLAGEVGFLQRPAMPSLVPQPWEHADTVVEVMTGWAATDPARLGEQAKALRTAHQRAQVDRRAAYAALLTASSGDPARWREVQAIATACQLAADAEERRKVLQMRFLRLARVVTAQHGLPLPTTTLADLETAVTTPMSPTGLGC